MELALGLIIALAVALSLWQAVEAAADLVRDRLVWRRINNERKQRGQRPVLSPPWWRGTF